MKKKLTKAEQVELDRITRVVSGALKSTIDAHGPITEKFISSASKRLANQIFSDFCGKKPRHSG